MGCACSQSSLAWVKMWVECPATNTAFPLLKIFSSDDKRNLQNQNFNNLLHMSEQKRTRTRRKLKFIMFPVFTSIFATRKRHYKTGYKTFPTCCSWHLQSLHESVQDEPKDCSSESSRQMLTRVWQPHIAILILSAEVSAGTGLLRADDGMDVRL